MYSEPAQKVIKAIEANIAAGNTTADVKSFNDLHEVGDANEYLIDGLELDMTEFGDAEIERCNAVIVEVNHWLASR